MKAAVIVLAVLVLGAASAPAAPPLHVAVDPQFLITSGVGIGSIRLGMTEKGLLATLGPTTHVVEHNGSKIYGWLHGENSLTVFVGKSSGVVERVGTSDPAYLLANGLHCWTKPDSPQTTLTAVLATMGTPLTDKSGNATYGARTLWLRILGYKGIEFWTYQAVVGSPDSHIIDIFVYPP
jgi:hypothetical protein